MYDVLTIASYIVKYSWEKGYSLSNLKLQKLLYFIQAQFLVSKKQACFNQDIEAWEYGPVVPAVYQKYKMYGGASIPYAGEKTTQTIESSDEKLIDRVIDYCSKYTASYLVAVTHAQNPWKDVYVPNMSNVISKDSIKKFFTKQ